MDIGHKSDTCSIKVVFGLGNPGIEYAATRHNFGAKVLRTIAYNQNTSFSHDTKLLCERATCHFGNEKVDLCVPMTYMNESGRAVLAYAQYYKIKPEEILVLVDDLDNDLGVIKLKIAGGPNGHNGLRSIEKMLGSRNYPRLKLGIGRSMSLHQADYVLGCFTAQEGEKVLEVVAQAAEYIDKICREGIGEASAQKNQESFQETKQKP